MFHQLYKIFGVLKCIVYLCTQIKNSKYGKEILYT